MRSPSPAFQFYPKDWLSDGSVRAMTHEERGVYADLLSICWLEDGLPAELPRLARLVSVPPRRFERLWATIGRCFQEKDGRLSQKRLDEEKSKQLAFRDLQSKKGKKGGKSHVINKDRKPRLTRGLTGGKAESKPESSFPVSVPSSLSLFQNEHENGNEIPADAGRSEITTVPLVRVEAERETWLTPYGNAWMARWGGESVPPYSLMAGAWGKGDGKRALKQLGQSEFLARWVRYLAAAQEAKWAKPASFLNELGQWAERPSLGPAARAGPVRATVGDRAMAEAEAFLNQRRST